MPLRDPIDPTRYYQINGVAYKIKSAILSLGVANNQSVIAAVSSPSSVHRIMGFDLQSSTAAIGVISFKDGSGGTFLWVATAVPAIGAPPPYSKPIVDSGYFETSASTGLFADVGTAAVNGTVYYITYAV